MKRGTLDTDARRENIMWAWRQGSGWGPDKPRNSKDYQQTTKDRRDAENGWSLTFLRTNQSCPHPAFRFHLQNCKMSFHLSRPICGTCHISPSKLIQTASSKPLRALGTRGLGAPPGHEEESVPPQLCCKPHEAFTGFVPLVVLFRVVTKGNHRTGRHNECWRDTAEPQKEGIRVEGKRKSWGCHQPEKACENPRPQESPMDTLGPLLSSGHILWPSTAEVTKTTHLIWATFSLRE